MKEDSDVFRIALAISLRVAILLLSYPIILNSIRDLETLYTLLSTGKISLSIIYLIGIVISSLIIIPMFFIIVFLSPTAASIMILMMVISERYDMNQILVGVVITVSLLMYSTLAHTYRAGELRFLHIQSKGLMRFLRILLASALIIVFTLLIPVSASAYILSLISLAAGLLRVYNIYEASLIEFITRNPVGIMILTFVFLSAFSLIAWGFFTILSLYILKPSKNLFNEFFRDVSDLDSYFKIPLSSLRDFFVSLLLAPFVYSLILGVLNRFSGFYPGGVWDYLMAFISFILSWILIKILFNLILSQSTPNMRGLGLGVILIAIIYIVSYVAWGWDPSQGILRLKPLDEFIYSTVYRYYYLLYYLIETLGVVMGFVP
ncbi:MAG: hypothetical protein QXS45_00500 [Sulfolobales archaeon]